MHTRYYQKIVYLPLAALVMGWALFAGVARGSPQRAAAETTAAYQQEAAVSVESYAWDFQAEATSILGEVRGLATELDRHADKLQSLVRHNTSRDGQASQLNLMAEQVNAIGSRLERLQDIKHVTASWQQAAIDRIQSLAAGVAAGTESAIAHLNENGNYLFAPSYQENVNSAAEQASELKSSVADFIDYGRAEQRVDQLRSALEVS